MKWTQECKKEFIMNWTQECKVKFMLKWTWECKVKFMLKSLCMTGCHVANSVIILVSSYALVLIIS